MHTIHCFIKRLFDILSASALALALTPLWIVVAIAIKLDSKGPVFFKQGRRTKDGRIFNMLKFRSMVVNAEQMDVGLFNYENDPRVTKVGRFLRNSSIDELPQLFNIIKGDMSVVGPRPSVSYELGDFDTLNKRYKKRFQVKAGLTGLAQTKGRNDISWDNKVEFDNQYVDEFNRIGIFADIKILFDSVIKVFKKENIYENKADESMTDAEAAKFENDEIIRIAHLPD
ncbi:sugar transferase [Fibrobacter sp. UWB7]|uniref:sugar transferase n=1 Tax=Fibrobacter sp. UWB7 TaxID=1896206 RepID=UPI00091A184A|nr:Sugar transferase involved in LPS biosynthesis (colanic, teichoic acid) [Fibrobacter sp. UWB7]